LPVRKSFQGNYELQKKKEINWIDFSLFIIWAEKKRHMIEVLYILLLFILVMKSHQKKGTEEVNIHLLILYTLNTTDEDCWLS